MPKKPKPANQRPKIKMTPAEQSRAFIQKAREIGVDESGKEFERIFKKVARKKSG